MSNDRPDAGDELPAVLHCAWCGRVQRDGQWRRERADVPGRYIHTICERCTLELLAATDEPAK